MNFRKLTEGEIETLKKQGNSASDWSTIQVKNDFVPHHIFEVHFHGNIRLGNFEKTKEKNLSRQPGLFHSVISDCSVGDRTRIADVNLLHGYEIGDGVIIERVDEISIQGETTFGNGQVLDVLNEGGGRELPIYDRLSSQVAYLVVLYSHDKPLADGLRALIKKYADSKKSSKGTIAAGAVIKNTKVIRNVNIGSAAVIDGAGLLTEGTIISSADDPVKIGEGVIAKHFIIQEGTWVESATLLDKVFVGQGVRMGKQFSAENSVFFANAEGFHGEAVSLFAGPYAVTHHKSTLLIAALVSFYNAGSGTNQSNHMYKLGPLHQGIMERGCKTGSFAYLLWPCRVGAYSVVMGKHSSNFDTSDLPFSYITAEEDKSFLTPAMNMITVGTRRDIEKWPNRDRRKTKDKLDLIVFQWLNPWIIQKVKRGIDVLNELYEKTPKEQDSVNYKGVRIKRLLMKSCRKYYEMLIPVFIGEQVITMLEKFKPGNEKEWNQVFQQNQSVDSTSRWLDIGGLIINETELKKITGNVAGGLMGTIAEFQDLLKKAYDNYEMQTWAWTKSLITDTGKPGIEKIIREWKENKIRLNNMILSDAKKEFDQASRIGFGADGGDTERDLDFTAVRGTYEGNKFVKSVLDENRKTEESAEQWLKWLNQ